MTTTPPLPKQWRDAEIARLRAAIRAVAKESHAATRGIVALHIINAEEPVAPVPEQPDGHWWLRTEVERLRARLEVNPEAPQWDGIACRDETIRILELEIKRLRAAAQGQSAQAPAQPARLPSGEYICKACDCWRTFNLDGQCIWCHWQHPQLSAAPAQPAPSVEAVPCHKLDTPGQVFFYEQDFYVLSNFSAFSLQWGGHRYPTSEHVYHVEKFRNYRADIAEMIAFAPSAHEAFKIAERNRADRRPDWDEIKVEVMREILRAKAEQHEYVRRKLLATGDRELIEDSWRDDFWGWGPNRDGQNMLGKLWMEVRSELRAAVEALARAEQEDVNTRRLTGLWRFGSSVLPTANVDFYGWLFQLDGLINSRTRPPVEALARGAKP